MGMRWALPVGRFWGGTLAGRGGECREWAAGLGGGPGSRTTVREQSTLLDRTRPEHCPWEPLEVVSGPRPGARSPSRVGPLTPV